MTAWVAPAAAAAPNDAKLQLACVGLLAALLPTPRLCLTPPIDPEPTLDAPPPVPPPKSQATGEAEGGETAEIDAAAAASAGAEAEAAAAKQPRPTGDDDARLLAPLAPLLALMRGRRDDGDVQAAACEALARLASGGEARAKAIVREGGVKPLLFAMRTHIKRADVAGAAVGALRRCAAVNDKVRAIMVAAGTVPMVCAVLKRHDLMPQLKRDGTATLAALVLASDEGARAAAADAHGVEALVGGLMHCGKDPDDGKMREPQTLASGRDALKKLVDEAPALRQRVERANGKRFLPKAAA